MPEGIIDELHNVNISAIRPLISPHDLRKELPIPEDIQWDVVENREAIRRILNREDDRLMVVVGPCSIHDPVAAWEYAQRLNELRLRVKDKMLIIMRMYFEKPRTTIGWKGLINDPHLDESCNMNEGLRIARELLCKAANLHLPLATEILDPITPQYTASLLSWGAIGARTTESQTHREVTSGLSFPVGFKNATSGSIQVALDAIQAAGNPHTFIGLNQEGKTSMVRTKGNSNCHIVLRGGYTPNYDAESIAAAVDLITKAGLNPGIMVDCSHSNSGKDYTKQPAVLSDVLSQRKSGNTHIIGVMLESNIHAGNQKIPTDLSKLAYGVSITDACMDWEMTESILLDAYRSL